MELDQFIENEKNRSNRWIDTLPEEVRSQILESNAGAAQISRWLINIGFQDATARKVEPLIEQRRRQRE